MKLFDYECFTTFWDDFFIADAFGAEAVLDTYNRAFSEWKSDYKYLTELVMVLNHKMWEHHENGHQSLADTYYHCWNEANDYAWSNLKGEELSYYFFNVTD